MSHRRKIAVVTATRAEYGLLYHTLRRIQAAPDLELQLLVTGTHLLPQYGHTVTEIEGDGFPVARRIPMPLAGDRPRDVATALAVGTQGFAAAYDELAPDLLLLLGDRHELLAAAGAAVPFNLPLAHVSGGETTEGATDELVRHAVTKMAHLHFPGAACYADNLCRMGEERWRVYAVGDPGIENIRRLELLKQDETWQRLGVSGRRPVGLVTLHPTTVHGPAQETLECDAFFAGLRALPEWDWIITYPNADPRRSLIVAQVEAAREWAHARVFRTLGSLLFLSAMKHCAAVVGNSSSGIVEAPFLRVPSVDYGERQKGRLKAASVVTVPATQEALVTAVRRCREDALFRAQVAACESLYGDGDTSARICAVIGSIPLDAKLLRKRLLFSPRWQAGLGTVPAFPLGCQAESRQGVADEYPC